ncbi:MAG: response regulator [Candidatus Hydrogenedentes bacterium]|nr:response regulator [Candidatus Hydrogenedentota bacterium]
MARILVIDDHYAMRQTIREILEVEGHEVIEAPEGDSGIQMQQRTPADLVITDIFMPHKEGMTTIRELRAANPALPIIAMSGGTRDLHAPEGFIDLARRFGATGTLTKPFQIAELLLAVGQALGAEQKFPALEAEESRPALTTEKESPAPS